MIDDFEKNQNNYVYDEELSEILNPDESIEDSGRMRRSMKASKYQRLARKRHIMWVRLRKLARFLLTLFIIYLTYRIMVSSRWYLPTDTITSYKIKKIQIIGNKITPTYKIVNAISDVELPHKPIYMIKTDEFSKKILSLAPIKKVYVKRLWSPARIIIYVEEKEPILTIAPSEDVEPIAFFSKEGTLINRDYLPLPEGYDPILVLSYGNKNDDYVKWDKNRVLSVEKLAVTLEKFSGEKVEYLDMREPDDIYAQLTSTKIRIGSLDSNTYKRIKDIKSIIAETKSLNKEIKYIDLSWDESKFIKFGNDEHDSKTTKEDSDSTNQH